MVAQIAETTARKPTTEPAKAQAQWDRKAAQIRYFPYGKFLLAHKPNAQWNAQQQTTIKRQSAIPKLKTEPAILPTVTSPLNWVADVTDGSVDALLIGETRGTGTQKLSCRTQGIDTPVIVVHQLSIKEDMCDSATQYAADQHENGEVYDFGWINSVFCTDSHRYVYGEHISEHQEGKISGEFDTKNFEGSMH